MSSRALIVGCGRIAGGYNQADEGRVLTHVGAYRRLGVEIAGCVDADDGIARVFAQRWGIEHHGMNLDGLLALVRPDIVSLCTPPSARLDVLQVIVRCPSVRSVFVEKPLALGRREAANIVSLLLAKSVVGTVNYFRAFDPGYQDLEAAVRKGDWGRLQSGVVRYSGAAWSNPPHFLERLVAMFGEPRHPRRLDADRLSPAFTVSFSSAPVHFIPCPDATYSPYELDLCFEHARVRIVDSEERIELFSSVPHASFPGAEELRLASWAGRMPSHDSLLQAASAAVQAIDDPSASTALLRRSVMVVDIMAAILGDN